ncbi:rhp14 [Ecytonucleospora hepatopenaei]|uniref:Rhp14 n=1 Tax=Ecytonucleospora hepatopenaei TaxID=646526 RepID=A0A1W0E5T7_9MICR|nr:rhp14 [Ecytonucleospora hepatopenaei]
MKRRSEEIKEGGFLFNEKDNIKMDLKYTKEPKISYIDSKNKSCEYCGTLKIDVEILDVFDLKLCTKCKIENIKFITKTECKNEYLLNDQELKNFPCLNKPNPRKGTWNQMFLYCKSSIEQFAIKKYGSLEEISKLKKQKECEKLKKKVKKIKKLVKKSKTKVVISQIKEKHKHYFKQKGNKGVCDCGMEIEMTTL